MHKILSLLILLHSLLLTNENDYSIIINKPFNDALNSIVENHDRTVSAVGFSTNYETRPQNPEGYSNPFDYIDSLSKNNATQISFVKVDGNANIISNITIPLDGLNSGKTIIQTSDNGYFVGGHTFDGSIIVLRLNEQAKIISQNIFGTKNNDSLSKLIPLRDGGVLAISSSVTSRDSNENIFQTGLGLNDIYLTKISKDSNIVWSKKYGTEFDDFGIDATEARDGSLLILSYTKKEDAKKDVFVMRIDENGDKIWKKQITNNENTNPYKISTLKENNFIISLTSVDEFNKEQVRLIKLDLYKNILLDKIIETTYESAILDLKEYSDTKLIGVGYVKDIFNTDGLIMLLDSNLNLLFQDHYGEENYDSFNSVVIMHNSQAVIAGVNTAENSQESNMWIIKINKDGSLAQKSTKSFDFLSELKKVFAIEIEKNLLEINDDLSINLLDQNLYFDVAEYKLTVSQKQFLNTFSTKLVNFLYKNKEFVNTLEINGHTSSEWGKYDFDDSYLNNQHLSMQRAYTTIHYIFSMQNNEIKKWLVQVLRGSGYSYSKKITTNENEDLEKSRRVNFKIILN